MFKKAISLVLAGLLLNMAGALPPYAESKEKEEARFAAKVREGIGKLGTGEEARVEIRLRDRSKLRGYVSEAREDSFVVVDETGVAYPQVKQVKGSNLAAGAKIALGLAAVIGIIFLVVALTLPKS